LIGSRPLAWGAGLGVVILASVLAIASHRGREARHDEEKGNGQKSNPQLSPPPAE
jgi:hypothetical protein